ncbi:Protein YIPF6 [Acropora cervicornis]|uniref:Protein YIPF6 n=1 Tax=Acropora cervicornis TaxID=6130 RepID=A0AAD9QL40_ACRCE|nr:Protein YIPF6 [Acropora cervicornis]
MTFAVEKDSFAAFINLQNDRRDQFIVASVKFLGDSQPNNRKALAVYPIGLFYFVIGWMIISHSG